MSFDPTAIAGAVFDKDGCLFDFNATWGAWAREVFETETAGDPDRLAALAEALGYDLQAGRFFPGSLVIASTSRETAAAALPFLEETSLDALVTRWNKAASKAPQVEVTPLRPFFARLQAAGLKIGLATNDAEAPARAHLQKAGAIEAFDFIAGFDSGYGAKPGPGQLNAFCAHTGLAPDACIMVGDSTHDLHAARAAGMIAVGVLTGVAGREDLAPFADLVVNSITELPALLKL